MCLIILLMPSDAAHGDYVEFTMLGCDTGFNVTLQKGLLLWQQGSCSQTVRVWTGSVTHDLCGCSCCQSARGAGLYHANEITAQERKQQERKCIPASEQWRFVKSRTFQTHRANGLLNDC
ncbi:hypothetical protein Q8A67_018954 [Cirrhinus molitorella]|uniref:Secreted protein n=1 Tax=Cirrhinus molitorella TaxID=172907 RepID=A0AA88PA69_9TELE|nr:hypothetical protein Q8A67_018954 [Cirrhinus molitorella]